MNPEITATSNEGATRWLFTFAARGIQNYVLGSDQLKEIEGATEIVDLLPQALLDKALTSLDLKGKCEIISRTAGQARLEFDTEADGQRLAAVWPMICRLAAPGLETSQALTKLNGSYLDGINEAECILAMCRNFAHADLPEVPPLAERNPRTALAAVPAPQFPTETMDAQGLAKRKAHDDLRGNRLPAICRNVGFTDPRQVPQSFETISGRGREYLAVLHADGNGFGEMFLKLGDALRGRLLPGVREFYSDLCRAIERMTHAAARKALEPLIPSFDGAWPVLPIVLAGDDLTMVMRADLAFPFVQRYLEAFACESRRELRQLAEDHHVVASQLLGVLPAEFSASAGIAFVKRRYPYASASALSESLAHYAKRVGRASRLQDDSVPSTVAFHQVSASSSSEDYQAILDGFLLSADGKTRLTLCPYAVGPISAEHPLPSLATLGSLAATLGELPNSQTRGILEALRQRQGNATARYTRLESLAQDGDQKQKKAFAEVERLLRELTRHEALFTLPLPNEESEILATPLEDALVWKGFLKKPKAVSVESQPPPTS